jgi:hypothetical protein
MALSLSTGFLDSPFRAKDYDFSLQELFGSTPVGNKKWLKDHVRAGENQGPFQACTSFGVSQVIWINEGTFGVPADAKIYPSVHAGYYQGRARKWGYKSIFDIGSALHHVWEGWRHGGLISEDDLPFGSIDIDAKVPKHLYRESADKDWLQYRWVLDPPGSRARRIKQTIDHERALTMAVEVDKSFEQWQLSHGPWARKYSAEGSHLMAIFGYEEAGVWVANSHGPTFGEGGFILISWEQVENPESRGFSTAEFDMEKLEEFLKGG